MVQLALHNLSALTGLLTTHNMRTLRILEDCKGRLPPLIWLFPEIQFLNWFNWKRRRAPQGNRHLYEAMQREEGYCARYWGIKLNSIKK